MDPTADTRQEANETVSVQLTAGSGYTVGTSAALTGTILNDDFIGGVTNNSLTGTSNADFIDGGAGADTLTGLSGADRFAFRFSQSSITKPDRLTDFAFASDKITLLSGTGSPLAIPSAFSRAADNSTATTLQRLATNVFADANGALTGNQPLAANAAALVRATNPAIAGTYLLINDSTAALSTSNDLLIHLTGHSGTLPAIGIISASSVFARLPS
jgi:Ca2+-binding RTX toxin-like protein